jgi:hypothetical protein
MAEQPVNLPTAIYLGVFSRAEQRVLQAIFKVIAEVAADVSLPSQCSPATRTQARQPRATRSTKRSQSAFWKNRTPLLLRCLASQHSDLREALMVPHNADVGVFMTLQEAKSNARHLGLTLRKVCSGDYRVNFRDGNETTAYYTDNLEDAVNTAVEMARKRALRAEPYRVGT